MPVGYLGRNHLAESEIITYSHQFVEPSDEDVVSWQVIKLPDEPFPTLLGGCPVCHDQWQYFVSGEVVQGGTLAEADDALPPAMTRLVECNCRADHHRPEGVQVGCGRYWLVTLTLEVNGDYRLSAERNLVLLSAAETLNRVLATQDSRIQGAAEKWIGAVTAIYGLFSLTGIATAKDALSGLSVWSKVAVAVVLAVGLAAAVSALTFGYRAAYGWPRTVEIDDNKKLRAWYKEYRSYSAAAARQLRLAVYLATGSLGAIAVVMILVWFLPRH